jgi:hypothetical protein
LDSKPWLAITFAYELYFWHATTKIFRRKSYVQALQLCCCAAFRTLRIAKRVREGWVFGLLSFRPKTFLWSSLISCFELFLCACCHRTLTCWCSRLVSLVWSSLGPAEYRCWAFFQTLHHYFEFCYFATI